MKRMLCLLTALGVAGCSDKIDVDSEEYKAALAAGEDFVLATYKDQEILASVAEFNCTQANKLSGTEVQDLRETVDKMIENTILLEEAERLGFAATPEEIEEHVEASRAGFATPEGKKIIDEYCAELGISTEEYFERLREQLPRTIARQKLRDEVGRKYCESVGIEFTKINQPAEVGEAVEKYIADLVAQNRKHITYYFD